VKSNIIVRLTLDKKYTIAEERYQHIIWSISLFISMVSECIIQNSFFTALPPIDTISQLSHTNMGTWDTNLAVDIVKPVPDIHVAIIGYCYCPSGVSSIS